MAQSVIPSSGPASKPTPPSRPRYRPSSANPVLELGKGRVLVLPAEAAFSILHDLHLRCTACQNELSTHVIGTLSHRQAKRAYRTTLAFVVASFTIMDVAERRACFEVLVKFCTDEQSLGGLESVFLTLLADISRVGKATDAEIVERLWERIGPPRIMGGGHRSGFFFDSTTNCMTRFEKAYLESLSSADLASLVGEGAGMASALERGMRAAASTNAPLSAEDGGAVSGAELARAICAVAGRLPGIGASLAVEAAPEGWLAAVPGIGTGLPGICTGLPGTGTGMPGTGTGLPGTGGACCTAKNPAIGCCCCNCCSGCCCGISCCGPVCCDDTPVCEGGDTPVCDRDRGGARGAMPDKGAAYRSALLILGARSLATSSLLAPRSARAFSIQTGPATSLIIRVPALQFDQERKLWQ